MLSMYIKSCFKFDADTKMGRLVFDPYVWVAGYICRNKPTIHCMGQNYLFFLYAKNHYDIKIMFLEDI